MQSGGPSARDRLFNDPDGEPKAITRRPCLCCSRAFDSTGPGHRLCAACRARASDVSPYAL